MSLQDADRTHKPRLTRSFRSQQSILSGDETLKLTITCETVRYNKNKQQKSIQQYDYVKVDRKVAVIKISTLVKKPLFTLIETSAA